MLAQRKDAGEIRGSVLIDGRPQGISFQRTTGYCEQMDVHEGTATVKEALIFSAVLRQPESVPYEEKLAYVEHIIDLLELRDISDALIGRRSLFKYLDALSNADSNQNLVLVSASNSANVLLSAWSSLRSQHFSSWMSPLLDSMASLRTTLFVS